MEAPKQQVPDILTQVSREKHRRRMQYYRLYLALGLILVLGYYGYANVQYGKQVERIENSCYLCGMYYGKQCEQVYYSRDPTNNFYTNMTPQEKLQWIAEYNAKEWPSTRYIGGQFGDSLNQFYADILNVTTTNTTANWSN